MASQYDLPYTGNQVETLLGKVSELERDMPEKVSDLQNDAGYITEADIPTDVSTFNNDAGYITNAPVTTETQRAQQAEGALAGRLDAVEGKIPSGATTSNKLVTDADIANFITKSVNDLVNYYTKAETYTQTEVRELIAAINQFHYEIYASISAVTSPASNVLYLIGPTGSGSDRYEEYVYSGGNFVKIGDTSIELSGYVTTTALNTALANYTTTSALTTLLAAKADKDTDAVEGNIAQFDGNGNPVDSGIAASYVSQLGLEIPKLFIACNANNCVNGYFSTANGTTINGETDGISVASLNYLSVLPGYSVLFDNPNNYLVAYYFYDEDKNFISGSAVWFASVSEIVIPDDAYYVRFAFRLTSGLTKDTIDVLVLRKVSVVDNITTDSSTNALSAKQGKLLGELQAQNFLYWAANNKPQFKLNGDSSSSVDITFPNKAFSVYSRNGVSILGTVSTLNNLTINVPTAQKLILHKTTKAYAVVALDATPTDDEILLFSNTYQNAFDGLLAPYYYMQRFGELKNNIGVSAYFIREKVPQFSINGTTLKIRMPIASEKSALRIYSVTDGVVIKQIATADQVYEIPTTYKLVYDLADASIKVVAGTVSGSFIDLLTNNNLNITGILAPYYLQYQNSILNLYYNQKERVILQNLQKKNVTGTSESGLPPLILLHFSDIHKNGANLQRIMDYHTMFSDFFADILNTGDNINDSTDSYDFYTDIDGTENILTAIGNHDVSQGNSGVDIYNKEIAPFVANWGVVQPANAPTLGLCYYYKDYTASKIRLIVLDNFAPDMSAQASWLADVLADAKTNDLCVVCAGHFPCPMDLIKESTFCSLDGGTQPNPMQSTLIDAVSTFIAGGGKFACWVTGHTHEDLFGTVANHPEQVCITVSSASQSRNAGSAARILGTKSQDSFNVISIDENTHCLKVHKIGADRDRYLRHIGEMCYNYQTGTLVYND